MTIGKKAKYVLAGQLLQASFLNEREKDILKARLGLESREPATLQEIGDKYSITRERVRQIGAAIVRKTKKFLPEQRYLAKKLFEKTWEPKYLAKEHRLILRRAIIKRNRTIVRNKCRKLAGLIEEFSTTRTGKEKIAKLFKQLRIKFRRNKSLFEPDVVIELKSLRQRWREVRSRTPSNEYQVKNEKQIKNQGLDSEREANNKDQSGLDTTGQG